MFGLGSGMAIPSMTTASRDRLSASASAASQALRGYGFDSYQDITSYQDTALRSIKIRPYGLSRYGLTALIPIKIRPYGMDNFPV